MKQGTMNILFFVLKTKLLKNGEAPVLMRITINGSYDDARIQRSVPLNLWNAAKGCSKGRDRASIALNTYIAELHARALEKHKELVLEQARLCKLNCVMLYSHSISSVGERPAPRGGTTRPDERKITII